MGLRSRALRLPWPPSVNSYWMQRGMGGRYLSKAGRAFREEVVAEFAGSEEPMSGRLRVSLELTPPDKRGRDIDNHIKAVLDALEAAGVFVNDEQVDRLLVQRMSVESPGCCDVVIQEVD